MTRELDPRENPNLSKLHQLEERLGYQFGDLRLLAEAMRHPSWANEHGKKLRSYDRLEFLGDAVVGLAVTERLMASHEQDEGVLTNLRQRIVRKEGLVPIAQGWGLGESLLLGVGEEASGGRQKAANLENALEAVVGAIYLDGGLEAVRRVLAPVLVEVGQLEPGDENYKTRFQEVVQALSHPTPRYVDAGKTGPDHNPTFLQQVWIGEHLVAEGEGPSKKKADQAAAKNALARWPQILTELP